MWFWNSKAKHPIEKIKVEKGKTKKEKSMSETLVLKLQMVERYVVTPI